MRGLQLDQKERDLKNRKAELDRKEEELIEAVKVRLLVRKTLFS